MLSFFVALSSSLIPFSCTSPISYTSYHSLSFSHTLPFSLSPLCHLLYVSPSLCLTLQICTPLFTLSVSISILIHLSPSPLLPSSYSLFISLLNSPSPFFLINVLLFCSKKSRSLLLLFSCLPGPGGVVCCIYVEYSVSNFRAVNDDILR